jgi:hypothetical protein
MGNEWDGRERGTRRAGRDNISEYLVRRQARIRLSMMIYQEREPNIASATCEVGLVSNLLLVFDQGMVQRPRTLS